MRRRLAALLCLALVFASCSSSNDAATEDEALVDDASESEAPATVVTVEFRDRAAEADALRALDDACAAGDDEKCEELVVAEEDLQSACTDGDDLSCAVLDTVEVAEGDLLCVSWDDLQFAESARGTFAEAAQRTPEEDERFNDTEALRLRSLDVVSAQLGNAASDPAGVAIQSLALLPLDLPDAQADVDAQMDQLAVFLDVACAPAG